MKTANKRALNRQLRELRQERKRWLTGQHLHWGQPWCDGRETCHKPDFCEGCVTAAQHREHADRIGQQIAALKPPTITAPVQGALF